MAEIIEVKNDDNEVCYPITTANAVLFEDGTNVKSKIAQVDNSIEIANTEISNINTRLGNLSVVMSPASGHGTSVTSGSTQISNGTYFIWGKGSTGSNTSYYISVGGTEQSAYQNVNQGYGSSKLFISCLVTVTSAATITHNLSNCYYKKVLIQNS